jgi:hypothetical protein
MLVVESRRVIPFLVLERAIDPATIICYHVNKAREALGGDIGYTRIRAYDNFLVISVTAEPYDETIDPGWA